MSTYMAKASTVERRWFIIDAAGKPLGKTAVRAASILNGKHRPEYTPHVDCGEFVVIINAGKAVLTGNKLMNKKHYYHTGYVGGIKEVSYRDMMAKNPEKAVRLAVRGMLPHNSIGDKSITRLKVFRDDRHTHQAQKPVGLE